MSKYTKEKLMIHPSSTNADEQHVCPDIGNTNVIGCTVEKSLMLLTELLNGNELEKHSADEDSPWYENQVSGLRSYVSGYDNRICFEMWGWGTAFGKPEDRLIEIIKNPVKWEVKAG